MNIEILSSLTYVVPERDKVTLTIGTHNGKFHSDEVVACAILSLVSSSDTIRILRTRDTSELQKCKICVDIGGGRFDHHQRGFDKTRKNGIKYASAGLVWREYGYYLIVQFMVEDFFNYLTVVNGENVFQSIDRLISLVDSEDNGKLAEKHSFSFISSFLPQYFETSTEIYNQQFYNALLVTMTVLRAEIKTAIGSEITKKLISDSLNGTGFHNGILEMPSQNTTKWEEHLISINSNASSNQAINFIIFPYPNGGWAAQCVPPSLEDIFGQRIRFPKEWAGHTDKLPEVSGVPEATFCHNGCFFVRANTKEAVIELCNIATRLAQ